MGGQLDPVVQDAELAVLDDHGDDLATVDVPRWIFIPATIRPPWLETTRVTWRARVAGAGAGPARRAPCRRPRAAGVSGLGRVRARTPPAVMTWRSLASMRRVTRCPARRMPALICLPPMPTQLRRPCPRRAALASAPVLGSGE